MRGTRWLLGAVAVPPLFAAAPADAQRVRVDPYIEVEQVLIVPLSDDSSNVTTATGVAAGVTAGVQTARTQASADVRYEHFFGYDDNLGGQDVLTGIARGRHLLVPNLLSVEAGALASRSTVGGIGAAIGGNRLRSDTQLYSGYIGPQLATTIDGIGVTAGYRFGHTRVESDSSFDNGFGRVPVGLAEESTSHSLYASASAQPGRLPFGWTLSGAYEVENADPLDQRFELATLRADLTYPISRTVAVVGGIGYEDIQVSRRSPVLDANGLPVFDGTGRLQSDTSRPRQLVYDVDGLIYDGGLLWRPSPRTSVEARIGHRYGGTIFTGAANWQFSRNGGLSVVVFDERDTFGRSLTRGLSRLPTNFNVVRGAFGNDLLGCVFGAGGEGGCLNPLSTAFSATSFRTRGVNAVLSQSRGVTSYGVGGGFYRRSYDVPDFGPGAVVSGTSDQTAYLNSFYATRLGRRQSLGFDATASWYDPDLPGGGGGVFALSGQGQYGYAITNRLTASSALGLYYLDPEGFEDQVTAAARLALRYGF